MGKQLKIIIKEFMSDLKTNIKELFNKKTFYRQIPNLLTSIRALALIPFNILYFSGNIKLAIIILTIAVLTDSFDGKIARKYNLVSKFGADLDAICDKLMAVGVMIPVCSTNYILIINLILELIIATINCFAYLLNIKAKSSMIGKLKTWPLFITIIVIYISMFINIPNVIITFLITITAFLQVLTALDYLTKNFKTYISKERNI